MAQKLHMIKAMVMECRRSLITMNWCEINQLSSSGMYHDATPPVVVRVDIVRTLVSSPDPTSKEKKGLVNLGRILGPALRTHTNEIAALLSHMTSLPQECNIAV